MRRLAMLFTITALGAACSESPKMLTDPTAVDPAESPIASGRRLPAPVDVQFQDPDLAGDTEVFDVYEDPNTGIRFSAPFAPAHISVNLLPNTSVATSACAPPADPGQQILGTGPVSMPGHSGEAIEAEFPVRVPPNRVVSAVFQAATGAPVRIRLYDAEGRVVATATERITEEAGQCGISPELINRGRVTVRARASVHIQRAVFDVPRLQPFGFVFAIDNLRIDPPRQ